MPENQLLDCSAPLALFHQGKNTKAYEFLGAHLFLDGKETKAVFRTWAPNAVSLSVVGTFNDWDVRANPMRRISDGGVWETVITGVKQFDIYKYAVETQDEEVVLKTDPYGFHTETAPVIASGLYDLEGYQWKEEAWLA